MDLWQPFIALTNWYEKAQTLIHEDVHTSTLVNDITIAEKLGGWKYDQNLGYQTNKGNVSMFWDAKLKEHCR